MAERDIVERLSRLAGHFAGAEGRVTADYGEVTGNNFQMMTMDPDPEGLASDLQALEPAATEITSLRARVAGLEEALEPSGATKYAYSGEFKFSEYQGTDDEGGEVFADATVPWTTIKEIMAAIQKRARRKLS